MGSQPAADTRRLEEPPDGPVLTLAQVREELDLLAERRLYKAFTDRDARRWEYLIGLEQSFLAHPPEPEG